MGLHLTQSDSPLPPVAFCFEDKNTDNENINIFWHMETNYKFKILDPDQPISSDLNVQGHLHIQQLLVVFQLTSHLPFRSF